MATATMARQQVEVQVEGLSPDQIRTLVLADGVHEVRNCRKVQFTIGEAKSPIQADGLHKYLAWTDSITGQEFYSPFTAILAVSGSSPQTRR